MKAEREAAEKEKRPFVYSRRWMADDAGRAGEVRGRGPQGRRPPEDAARGRLPSSTTTSAATWSVPWASEQDHVIQRADGTCLYNLANVVDDFDMKITHVIRAEEHLSNTPRQIFIARGARLPAAGVRPPAVRRRAGQQEQAEQAEDRAVPEEPRLQEGLRARPGDRRRASACTTAAETFNPVIVDFYEQVGYLPRRDPQLPGAARLVARRQDRVLHAASEMIELFSLERVNKAPASFDPEKLLAFQEQYMQATCRIEQKAGDVRCRTWRRRADRGRRRPR